MCIVFFFLTQAQIKGVGTDSPRDQNRNKTLNKAGEVWGTKSRVQTKAVIVHEREINDILIQKKIYINFFTAVFFPSSQNNQHLSGSCTENQNFCKYSTILVFLVNDFGRTYTTTQIPHTSKNTVFVTSHMAIPTISLNS